MTNNNNNTTNNTMPDPLAAFYRSFTPQQAGAGIDHAAGYEFWGPWVGGWSGPRGHHGFDGRHKGRRHGRRHHGRRNDSEREKPEEPTVSSDTEESSEIDEDFPRAREGPPQHAPPPGPSQGGAAPPFPQDGPAPPYPHDAPPPSFPFPGHHGPGGRHGRHPHPLFGHGHGPFGGRGGKRHCGEGRRHHQHDRPSPPPFGGPFDFRAMMSSLSDHPLAQAVRDYTQQVTQQAMSGGANQDQTPTFTPPADIFDTEKAFVVHMALPGASKEDIGVNWDAEKKALQVSGVVHRPGDEGFLASMTTGERKVGVFERSITLPPAGSNARDEVDGLGISARMENGILIVTVPKTEREWTEIHRVEIE